MNDKKKDISNFSIKDEDIRNIGKKIDSEKEDKGDSKSILPVKADKMELANIIGDFDFSNLKEDDNIFKKLDDWRNRRIIRKHKTETKKIVADAKEQALQTEIASWLSSYAALHKSNFNKVVSAVKSLGTTLLHDLEVNIQKSIQHHTAMLDENLEIEMQHIESTNLPSVIKEKRHQKAVENYFKSIDKICNEVYEVNEDELFQEYKTKSEKKKK